MPETEATWKSDPNYHLEEGVVNVNNDPYNLNFLPFIWNHSIVLQRTNFIANLIIYLMKALSVRFAPFRI